METFFRTHQYLVEHVQSPVERYLMDEIDWSHRLIGIKGSRGVGKTTFLLKYAKNNFLPDDHSCLYINLNNFYFTTNTIADFADDFRHRGGKVLLIDQIFKYPDWSKDLRYCYDNFPDLQIIFSGSSVMRLKEENPELSGCVESYNLKGYSFREFLNLMAGKSLVPYTLDEILDNHQEITKEILTQVKPLAYFQDYLHHGFYPFFLENRNFSENLLKTMNMMLEVDILLIQQMDLKCLNKIKKLLYLLLTNAPTTPNISQLSSEIATSRATVMNYMKYLKDARLLNMLYYEGEEFPKKPALVYMHNTNLIYPVSFIPVQKQVLNETFFYNMLHKDHRLNKGEKNIHFIVDKKIPFYMNDEINTKSRKMLVDASYYVTEKVESNEKNIIPLWLFGFLY
ncbi:MAG: AAA family ATPase [Candidatus Azobacteroides sp.]|nr:AAA family ATPase [Candidatus Azobacteroides sp.]